MRVVINQLAALRQKTGIGHYTHQLLRCLGAQAGQDQIDAFPTGWFSRAWEVCLRARPYLENGNGTGRHTSRKLRFFAKTRTRGLQSVRRWGLRLIARHFRRVCARQGYDLYHEPNFIPLPSDRPTLVTLHDLSVLLHPEWHPADRVAHFDRELPRALSGSVHFITVSEFTRQEVIRTLALPPGRVTRIYNGIRPELRPLPAEYVARALSRLGLPSRYLLYVGTLEPRKNVLLLLRAYCDLPASVRTRWPLLLAGTWGWNTAELSDYFHGTARHCGVMHLGYVGEQNLAVLYNGARALVYPSLYEGFGLPPLEMMACGGAVLASTAGAIAETAGGRAHLTDPADQAGWRDALLRVVTDDDWWRSLRRGVDLVARRYTWERCAAETLQVYGQVHRVHDMPPAKVFHSFHGQRRAAG